MTPREIADHIYEMCDKNTVGLWLRDVIERELAPVLAEREREIARLKEQLRFVRRLLGSSRAHMTKFGEEVLDAAARAICEELSPDCPLRPYSRHLDVARAALTAAFAKLREPSEAMKRAGDDAEIALGNSPSIFGAMVSQLLLRDRRER